MPRSYQPVKYPFDIVRRALGLAYGGHGFKLGEVAAMAGVPVPTVFHWKKRCIEGGVMEIPEIDAGEAGHLSPKDLKDMGKEELRRYVHELEVKAYVLEGTVKILKAEGIEGLSNDEKAALVDA